MLANDRTVIIVDEALEAEPQEVLIEWAMADFEQRFENRSQAYGMEQLLRFIGPSAVEVSPS